MYIKLVLTSQLQYEDETRMIVVYQISKLNGLGNVVREVRFENEIRKREIYVTYNG